MNNIKQLINQILSTGKNAVGYVKDAFTDPNSQAAIDTIKGINQAKADVPNLAMGLTSMPAHAGAKIAGGIIRQMPEIAEEIPYKLTSKSRFNPALGRALAIIRGEQKVSPQKYLEAGDMVIEYGQKLYNKPLTQLLKSKTLQDLATDLSIKLKL